MAESGRSLDDMLSRSDIEAVIIAVSIMPQPELVKRALRAGKHVLSEKPIANDTTTARELLEFHATQARGTLWGVSENYRHLPGAVFAKEQLSKIGGAVQTFSVKLFLRIPDDDRFLATKW